MVISICGMVRRSIDKTCRNQHALLSKPVFNSQEVLIATIILHGTDVFNIPMNGTNSYPTT